jgi:hypothetical protein
VTNFAHVKYRSHSHGPSCGRRKQRPNSNSVFRKFVFSQAIAEGASSPVCSATAPGPASVAPDPSTCTVRNCHPRSRLGSCRFALIVVNDAAKHIAAFHQAFFTAILDWYWAALPDTLMRARLVVVADVFLHHTPKMTFP